MFAVWMHGHARLSAYIYHKNQMGPPGPPPVGIPTKHVSHGHLGSPIFLLLQGFMNITWSICGRYQVATSLTTATGTCSLPRSFPKSHHYISHHISENSSSPMEVHLNHLAAADTRAQSRPCLRRHGESLCTHIHRSNSCTLPRLTMVALSIAFYLPMEPRF